MLNISSTGDINQSKRCYASEEVEKQRKAKGKEVIIISKGSKKDQVEINRLISEKETIEFLKLIK